MPTIISFVRGPRWIFDRDCVHFYAIADSKVINCLITAEALMHHFGAREYEAEEFLRAFRERKGEIEAVARQRIQADDYDTGDEVVLKTNDIPHKPTSTPRAVGPLSQRIAISQSSEIDADRELSKAIEAANLIFKEDLIRHGMQVSLAWSLDPVPTGTPIVVLVITDRDSGASVDGVFTRETLCDQPLSRRTFSRIWSDFLGQRVRVISETLHDPVGSGG